MVKIHFGYPRCFLTICSVFTCLIDFFPNLCATLEVGCASATLERTSLNPDGTRPLLELDVETPDTKAGAVIID